jgi:hypothetical protein
MFLNDFQQRCSHMSVNDRHQQNNVVELENEAVDDQTAMVATILFWGKLARFGTDSYFSTVYVCKLSYFSVILETQNINTYSLSYEMSEKRVTLLNWP